MRIAYAGNFRQPWTTENYVYKSLVELGHTVIQLQEDNFPDFRLIAGPLGWDLFLWTRTWPGKVTQSQIDWLREHHIPTASYHLDFYVGLPREANLDSDAFWRTDHVFQIDGDPKHMQVFKDKGINAHYLPAGVYKGDCRYGIVQPKFVHDIVFLGGAENYPPEWPYRQQLIGWLRQTYGSRFKRYPDDGVRLWGQDMNDLYASSKVVIGDSICKDFKQENAWSDRLYETCGRGGFIIHPYIKGLEDNYKLVPDVTHPELVTYEYGNFEQLKSLIDFYLDPNNAIIREKLRHAAFVRTFNNHTYENRMQELLDVVFKN